MRTTLAGLLLAFTANVSLAADPPPVKALLVLGGCCHDYAKQKEIITKGVSARANVTWTISYDPDKGTKHLNPIYDSADWAKGFDVIVHDECTTDVKEVGIIERILKPHKNGLPGVVLHCGMHSYRSEGYPKSTPWFDFTGLASTGHGPQQPIEISYEGDNPIVKGLTGWKTVNEELYNNAAGKLLPTATPLARGKQMVKDKAANAVVAWTNEYGEKKTKVFATTLGHNNDTVADDKYLTLLTSGLLWSVGKLDDPAYSKPAK